MVNIVTPQELDNTSPNENEVIAFNSFVKLSYTGRDCIMKYNGKLSNNTLVALRKHWNIQKKDNGADRYGYEEWWEITVK